MSQGKRPFRHSMRPKLTKMKSMSNMLGSLSPTRSSSPNSNGGSAPRPKMGSLASLLRFVPKHHLEEKNEVPKEEGGEQPSPQVTKSLRPPLRRRPKLVKMASMGNLNFGAAQRLGSSLRPPLLKTSENGNGNGVNEGDTVHKKKTKDVRSILEGEDVEKRRRERARNDISMGFLRSQYKDLKEKHSEQTIEFSNYRRVTSQKVEVLQKKNKSLKRSRDDREKTITLLRQEIKGLQDKLQDVYDYKMKQKENEIKELKKIMSQSSSARDKKRVRELESAVKVMKTKGDEKERLIAVLMKEVKVLTKKRNKYESQVDQQRNLSKEKYLARRKLSDVILELRILNKDLEKEKHGLEEKIDFLLDEIKSLKEIRKVEEDLSEVNILRVRNEKLRSEKNDLLDELEVLQEDFHNVSEENKENTAGLQKLQKDKEQLTSMREEIMLLKSSNRKLEGDKEALLDSIQQTKMRFEEEIEGLNKMVVQKEKDGSRLILLNAELKKLSEMVVEKEMKIEKMVIGKEHMDKIIIQLRKENSILRDLYDMYISSVKTISH